MSEIKLDTQKRCTCDSCKHAPHLTSLAAKATPAERAALDWIYSNKENTAIEAAFAVAAERERWMWVVAALKTELSAHAHHFPPRLQKMLDDAM